MKDTYKRFCVVCRLRDVIREVLLAALYVLRYLLISNIFCSDRKSPFSFNSLIRRPKKKSSQEGDTRSPTPLQPPSSTGTPATTTQSETKHLRFV